MRITRHDSILVLFLVCVHSQAQPINRQKLVERHTIVLSKFDSLSSLSVGNGKFCFTVDPTGLQSFPEFYLKGVPLGTQSEWGWHSYPNKASYQFEETLKSYHLNGRDITYSVQVKDPERSQNAVNYFRQNPHRLQLGNIGFDFLKRSGAPATMSDITDIRQSLNMWSGEIHSMFRVEGVPVEVITFCHQQNDVVAVYIRSPLINEKRLRVRFRLPAPNGEWKDGGADWSDTSSHQSSLQMSSKQSAIISHEIDTTHYWLAVQWKGAAHMGKKENHYFELSPQSGNAFSFSCEFTSSRRRAAVPDYEETKKNNAVDWIKFWKSGGAIDFSGSTDPRASELERRVILSQYLTRIQCAGNYPPQETGLTYNSWYGKPHLEMHWWHGIHFALWGRTELLERSLQWYAQVAPKARKLAERQGYDGIRWQKMTDNNGDESPSSVGAFLIWQQPHFIYFSELCYRAHRDAKTLQRYKDLVFATADFMASWPYFDSASGRYVLGKGVIAAQERFRAEETFNPAYELVYWQWALNTAQKWRERLGMIRNKKWDEVINRLSPLPVQGNKYLFTESARDSYTNPEFRTDHPSVFGAWGMLPKTRQVDSLTMRNTFDWIWSNWSWKDTWGWDFPMTAMTATRLGLPGKAVDALLMPVTTNTYLKNGHNYQDDRLTIYLPGNGGLLAAVAMMCAGYDDARSQMPGIPKDGRWKVKWEKLVPMP